MAGTFDWVEIRTLDVHKTARFYEQVFGWKLLKKEAVLGSEVWILDTGGEPRSGNLRRVGFWQRPAGSSLGILVYIWVDDIQATAQAIAQHGGQVLVPPADLGPGWMAEFEDPSGNRFGLFQDKEERA